MAEEQQNRKTMWSGGNVWTEIAIHGRVGLAREMTVLLLLLMLPPLMVVYYDYVNEKKDVNVNNRLLMFRLLVVLTWSGDYVE